MYCVSPTPHSTCAMCPRPTSHTLLHVPCVHHTHSAVYLPPYIPHVMHCVPCLHPTCCAVSPCPVSHTLCYVSPALRPTHCVGFCCLSGFIESVILWLKTKAPVHGSCLSCSCAWLLAILWAHYPEQGRCSIYHAHPSVPTVCVFLFRVGCP